MGVFVCLVVVRNYLNGGHSSNQQGSKPQKYNHTLMRCATRLTITDTDISTLAISSMVTTDVIKFDPEPPYLPSTSMPINCKMFPRQLDWQWLCGKKNTEEQKAVWNKTITYTVGENGFYQRFGHLWLFIHRSRKGCDSILSKLAHWNTNATFHC